MVKGTSKSAYASLKAGKLGEKQNAVLNAMSSGSHTRRELAAALNEQASSIAGRVNELIELGFIGVAGHRICKVSGIKVEGLAITGKGLNYKTRMSWSPNAGHGSMARASSTRSTQAWTAQEIRP